MVSPLRITSYGCVRGAQSYEFETLLNRAPWGVYLVDADMRIQEAKPLACTFFGDIPNLLGRDIGQVSRELCPLSDANELLKRVQHTVATGEMSLMCDLFDFNLGPEANYCYRGSIHRISDDGRPGAVCYLRGQPLDRLSG